MRRLHEAAAWTRSRPRWARFGAAALLVGLGFVARLALGGAGPGYPYFTFLLPLLMAAVFLGRGPGVAVAMTATALGLWRFVPPVGLPWVKDPRDIAAALAFAAGALALVLLAEAAFRAVAALRTVLEGIGEPFYALDANWCVLHVSRAALATWGMRREEVVGRRILDAVPETEGSVPRAALEAAKRTRRPQRLEAMSGAAGRWVEVDIHPTRDGGLSVAFRDVHERHLAEERQRLLVAELTHRIKNTLALVLAIAEQTRRTVASPDAFHAVFQDRLAALARAHDALRRDGAADTPLRMVARETLAPHGGGDGASRVEVTGPEVRLASGTAVALGMVFHELATNAVKHGALSVPEGRVRLSWGPAAPDSDGTLWHEVLWEEIGGPPVGGAPARRGFGMRLLEGGLAAQIGGTISLDFAPSGLRCRIRIRATDGAGAPHDAGSGAAHPARNNDAATPGEWHRAGR